MKTFVRNLSLKYKIQSIVWVSMFLLLAGSAAFYGVSYYVAHKKLNLD